MRSFLVTCVCVCLTYLGYSQSATVRGIVKDGNTGQALEAATVLQPPGNGTLTDISGNFELKVTAGEVTLIVSYIGLTADTIHLKLEEGASKYREIILNGSADELQTVVVSETRMGEKLQRVTQSVEVMKPRMLEDNNITNMENAVTKLPGVSILDGQIAIRGGSGYAYGAGSRVTLVVDDMTLMTADRQDIKWPLVPLENVEQMELVKGATSMQYGSSAMNGVMNVTTAYARDTPITKISLFYEGYGKPPVDSFKWWHRNGKFFQNPNRAGMSFLHSEKVGDFDIVFSGMLTGFQSYLQSDYENYARVSGKVLWHPHKFNRLTLEFESSFLYYLWGFQFWWQDNGHPYIAAPGVVTDENFFYAYFDPKVRYIDKKGNEHKIYGRIYRQVDLGGVSEFWVSTIQYQFRHDFGKIFRILAGVNNDHYTLKDGTLGAHKGDIGGGFVQGQLNYKFLTLNAGIRDDYFHQDSAARVTPPVFRAGANFEIHKYNYLRASFGQAFRVPSIAEEYVLYSLGSVNIIPNLKLKPEHGFTAEIGYKRSIKIGNWLGYVDASAFWTEFRDMIEFQFGIQTNPTPPLIEPYFQSQNVSHARIFGWEVSTGGEGHIAPNVEMNVLIGYTYFYGANIDDTLGPDNRNVGTFLKDAFKSFALPTATSNHLWDSITEGQLKYRLPHQFKGDVDFILFNKYHLGTALTYYSYMTRIDDAFTYFIPGMDAYRMQTRNKGSSMWDLRCGYIFNKNITLNFLVKNVLNTYTSIRPALPDPPRSYTVQLLLTFSGLHKHSARENNLY